jgi:ATP:corrinoid adenosyltransferase
MGEFTIVRPSINGEIDPVKGFTVEEKAAVLKLWESVKQQVEEGQCSYLILDGIGEAISAGIIPRSAVLAICAQRAKNVKVAEISLD